MRLLVGAAIALSLTVGANAQPADFSGSPIRIIAGAPPGTAMDIVARLVANKLGPELDTSVVVENLPGSLVQTAAREVQNARPDGHTMMIVTTSVAVAQALHKNLSYDLTTDFTGVSLIATGPLVLVARPGLGIDSVEDLIRLAKEKPGTLTFGSGGGTGSAFYLAIEMLKAATGTEFTIIPYQGSAQARNDLVGGHIDLLFEPVAGVIGSIGQGAVTPLAITTRERADLLADVPTMAEMGFNDFEATHWFGLVAPAATPEDRVSTLSDAVSRIVHQPDVVEILKAQGIAAVGGSAGDYTVFLKDEVDRWSQLIDERGIKAE